MNFLKIVLTAAVFVAAPTWAGDLTGPQKNAARSAKQYLSVAGFSRDGLIQQLSSDAGDGYEISDATVAVDSLNIDWNQEAVKSAKQYLSMMGFSCKASFINFPQVPETNTLLTRQPTVQNRQVAAKKRRGSNDGYT